jgi:hypothetical protein
MKIQLENAPNSQYNAGGIIQHKTLEVLVMECSGAFKEDSKRKIAFNNIKRMYGALACKKNDH